MIEFALNYLRKGYSIIPIGQDKKPVISSWSEFQHRLPTEQEVQKWWKVMPNANIAIITGKISGISVVDVEKGGDVSKLPNTTVIQTGGGGYHYYYQYKEGLQNAVRIAELTDIRNDGGYVIAPPSLHISGQKYKVVQEIQLAPFPIELFPVGKKQFNKKVIEETVVTGSRNVTITSMIGHWLSITPKKLWPSVLNMALTWNKENCKPPLSEYEVENTFKSIVVREAEKVRDIDKKFEEETVPVEVIHLSTAAEEHKKTISGEKMSLGIDYLDEVLGGGLQVEHLAIISGYTGEGKSLFAMYLTAAMLKANVPVLWFQFEIPPTEFWEKYQMLGVDKSMPCYVPKIYNTASMDWVEEVIMKSKELGVKVIVFDLLDFLQSGDKKKSNKNDEDTEIVIRLKKIASKHKVAIILMAHARKPSMEERQPTIYDIKGTGAISGISNWVLMVYRIKKDKKKNELTFEDNTKYSQFSIQKNRINGRECNFYGYYNEGKLIMATRNEIKSAQKSSDMSDDEAEDKARNF